MKPNDELIGVRLHVIETVPAGLLTVDPVMVKVVAVWLTVPPLLLYEYCVAGNVAAEASTSKPAQSVLMSKFSP